MRPGKESRDPRLEHLATIIQRVGYLEHMVATKGDPRGYLGREIAATTWAIKALLDGDPDLAPLVEQAEMLAEDRLAKSRAARGGVS